MYRRGHLRNSDTWRQVGRKPSTPMFTMTAAERVAAWEKKQAEAKAQQAGK
jgi:hypothetical protein